MAEVPHEFRLDERFVTVRRGAAPGGERANLATLSDFEDDVSELPEDPVSAPPAGRQETGAQFDDLDFADNSASGEEDRGGAAPPPRPGTWAAASMCTRSRRRPRGQRRPPLVLTAASNRRRQTTTRAPRGLLKPYPQPLPPRRLRLLVPSPTASQSQHPQTPASQSHLQLTANQLQLMQPPVS